VKFFPHSAFLRPSTVLSLGLTAIGATSTTGCSGPQQTPATNVPTTETSRAPLARVEPVEKQKKSNAFLSRSGSLLAPLPTAVTSFGIAHVANSAYVLGGYHGTPHAYSREGQSDQILRLNLKTGDRWEVVGTMKRALQGLAAVAYNERICQFGGTHASNSKNEPTDMRSVDTARCFDTKTKTWSELPPLPEPRSSHDATLIGDTVYVAGGWNLKGSPKNAEWSTEVLSLDLSTPEAEWTKHAAPAQIRAVGVGAAGDYLVIAGGLSPRGAPSSEVHLFNLRTKEWLKGPDFPSDAFGLAVVGQRDKIFASARDGMMRTFSPGDTKWTELRPLALPRFFHQLLPTNEGLLVVGGIGGMHTRGRTRPVELLPYDSDELAFGTLTLKHPGTSKNRQGIIQREERLYFFGGNNSLGQHDFERENFVDEGWVVDLATLSIREAAPYPKRRQSMVVHSHNSGGTSFAGFGFSDDSKSEKAKTATDIFSYDWEKEAWTTAGVLPLGRTQFGLAANEKSMLLLGGLNYDPTRKGAKAFDHLLDIQSSPIGQETFTFSTSQAKLPGPRRAFASTVYDGKFFLVGGMREGFSLVEDCLTFDTNTSEFSELPCPSGERLSGELVPAGNRLFLIGGSVRTPKGEIEESRRIEIFDVATQTWSTSTFEIPFSTRHMRALPFRNQILLFSTHNDRNELTLAILSPGKPHS